MTLGALRRAHHNLGRDFARCISWGWGGRSSFIEGHMPEKAGPLD